MHQSYLPYFKEDRDYILKILNSLVIKDIAEAGGYGVIFGKDLEENK